MNKKYPDYKNCIANLACSVLQYYGVESPNSPLAQADLFFQKEYKNVVVLLLDGMGVNIMEKHLDKNGFFHQNKKCIYSSTFPPTTVAATTALDSGLFPNQSGWLGWTGYFSELDRNIVYFWNVDDDTGEEIRDMNVARTYVPYESIRDKIQKTGINTHYIAPFLPPHPNNYDTFCREIKRLCDADGRKYISAYWDEPDHTMHDIGVDGEEIRSLIRGIEERTGQLASELSDTLLIITADHGHINTKNVTITQYPDIYKCLVRMPSVELRALNFFIKEGMEKQFEEAFHKHFEKDFMLLSKAQVLEQKLLGTGQSHKMLDSMLGDYLAIATGNISINNVPGHMKGNHAGITEDEMRIPLIVVEK